MEFKPVTLELISPINSKLSVKADSKSVFADVIFGMGHTTINEGTKNRIFTLMNLCDVFKLKIHNAMFVSVVTQLDSYSKFTNRTQDYVRYVICLFNHHGVTKFKDFSLQLIGDDQNNYCNFDQDVSLVR